MKQKDLIFDVGLHRGEDTDFYLRKGFRVLAFEADPENAAFCRTRFREAILRGQLTIIEGAIVDYAQANATKSKVAFYKNEANSVWGTVCTDWADRNRSLGTSNKLIEVDVVDFAAALREHGIPHYMKVDIEGCDMFCVRALKGFQERPNYVSIESDKTSLKNIRAEIDLLSELGYSDFQAVEQSSIVGQYPPRPAREGLYVDHRFELGSSGLFGADLEDRWQSKAQILRQYGLIRIGYYLVGENGILTNRRFRGAGYIEMWATRVLERITRAEVPGWYDTHARLATRGTEAGD
ncbi:MAG: FkbM family methyltransferase [Verrucomicrobiota bacterium]